jgi:hypothetical protein
VDSPKEYVTLRQILATVSHARVLRKLTKGPVEIFAHAVRSFCASLCDEIQNLF